MALLKGGASEIKVKINSIKSQLKKAYRNRPIVKQEIKSVKWKHPKTKRQWEIYYLYFKNNEADGFAAYPILQFYNKTDEKVHLVIFNKLGKFYPVLFRHHFISRYFERVSLDINNFMIIHDLLTSFDYSLFDYTFEGEKKQLYIYRYGLAMVRSYDEYFLFDTIVDTNKIAKHQKEAIYAHFDRFLSHNSLDPMEVIKRMLFILSIKSNPFWSEMLDNPKLKSELDKFILVVETFIKVNPKYELYFNQILSQNENSIIVNRLS